MALSGMDKEKQLQELSSIMSGIRLFNRDCGKGGEGVDDCKSLRPHVLIHGESCAYHTSKEPERAYIKNTLKEHTLRKTCMYTVYVHVQSRIHYMYNVMYSAIVDCMM